MAKDNETVNVNNVSRISAGTVCNGTIHSKYDLRIDGTFEGKMHSKGRIVVGETAVIKGDIVCDNIDVWGKLTGTVFVKDTLSMKSGCTVNGSINVRRFVVELGSEFNGTCKMITEEEYDKKVKEVESEYGPDAGKGTEFDAKGPAVKTADPVQQPFGQQPVKK